jgi:hypothetical protein
MHCRPRVATSDLHYVCLNGTPYEITPLVSTTAVRGIADSSFLRRSRVLALASHMFDEKGTRTPQFGDQYLYVVCFSLSAPRCYCIRPPNFGRVVLSTYQYECLE